MEKKEKSKNTNNNNIIINLGRSKSQLSILKQNNNEINNYEIDNEEDDSLNEICNNNKKIKRNKSFENNNDKSKKELEKISLIEKELINSIKKNENTNIKNLQLANSINFKSAPDKLIETDEFGFLKKQDESINSSRLELDININTKDKTDEKEKQKYLLLINSRTEKWIYMLQHYDIFSTKKYEKLKTRTRKGIPDNLRSNVWQLFAEMKKYKITGIFEKLSLQKLDPDTEDTILKDLDRTYPSCQLFSDRYGKGQRDLFKVLSCFCLYEKKIGYVQGISFITALFLTYMDEESSFFMLISLMEKYNMKNIYSPGFPDLKKIFYVLLNLEKKFVPNVYNILKRDEILPSLYASEWFICLFSKDLSFNLLVRIFDTFLLEGFKVIYRFALAILKIKENYFLECKNANDTLKIVRMTFNKIDIDYFFSIAFGFSLSKNLIKKLEIEFEENKDDECDEFISQL